MKQNITFKKFCQILKKHNALVIHRGTLETPIINTKPNIHVMVGNDKCYTEQMEYWIQFDTIFVTTLGNTERIDLYQQIKITP